MGKSAFPNFWPATSTRKKMLHDEGAPLPLMVSNGVLFPVLRSPISHKKLLQSINAFNFHTLSIPGLWHCDRFSRRLSCRVLVTMSYVDLEYDAYRSLVLGLRVRVRGSIRGK